MKKLSAKDWICCSFGLKNCFCFFSSAEIRITLSNSGPDGYKPEEFGDEITVVRILRSNNINEYRLFGSKKPKMCIAKKREELVRIMDRFNIQVDNPIALLNQDNSRQLLASQDANKLYRFFMNATLLAQMVHDFKMMHNQREEAQMALEVKLHDMKEMGKEVEDLKKKYKALEKLAHFRQQMNELSNEYFWALVAENEQVLEISII